MMVEVRSIRIGTNEKFCEAHRNKKFCAAYGCPPSCSSGVLGVLWVPKASGRALGVSVRLRVTSNEIT